MAQCRQSADFPVNDQEKLPTELNHAIAAIKPILKLVVYIGAVVNLLSLAPTLYMLEVYDRVVNSRNHTTLLMWGSARLAG